MKPINIYSNLLDDQIWRFSGSLMLNIENEPNFFYYYIFRKHLEGLTNYLTWPKRYKTSLRKKSQRLKMWRWIKRFGLSLGIMCFAYFFMQIPTAHACKFLGSNNVSKFKVWEILAKEGEKSKEEKAFRFSKKFLAFGGIALTLAIGAIICNRDTLSRIIFSPPLEYFPVYKYSPVCFTLEEREIIRDIDLGQHIDMRNEVLDLILKKFGKTNLSNLMKGKFQITNENCEFVFNILVRILNQYGRITSLGNYLNRYPDFFDPDLVSKFVALQYHVGESLNLSIQNNPATLSIFQSYMAEILGKVNASKMFDFTPQIQQEIVQDLVEGYLNQTTMFKSNRLPIQ